GGHCPHVRNDRVDLVVLEVVLEGGHARRAVEDVFAHDGLVAVGCGLVQRRTIGPRIEGRRRVADAAGLCQQLTAMTLLVVEIVGCLLGGGAAGPKRDKTGEEWHRSTHEKSSRYIEILQRLRLGVIQGKPQKCPEVPQACGVCAAPMPPVMLSLARAGE